MKRLFIALLFGVSLSILSQSLGFSVGWAQTPREEKKTETVNLKSHVPPLPPEQPSASESQVQSLAFNLSLIPADPQKIQVGDLLELRLDPVPHGKFKVQDSSTLLEDGFEIDSTHQSEQSIFVIPVRSGKLILPPLTLMDDQGQLLGKTQSLSLEVQSVLSEEESRAVGDSVGVIPPLGVEFPTWLIILLGVALAGVIAVIFYLLKNRRRNQTVKVEPTCVDFRTEDEIALQELEDLIQKDLLRSGKYKIYYFSLSEIIKTYIGARYGFHALEATTLELKSILKSERLLDERVLIDFESMFQELDRVKFTDHVPTFDEATGVLEKVRQWVLKTKKIRLSIQNKQSGSEEAKNASL